MRLVLAHEYDAAARRLAERWGSDAVLMTPAELTAECLVLEVDADGRARAELPSRPDITSVLSRLGGISPHELPHINPGDATYAAAELDAFLRAWLAVWPGPVLNRPTTTCLNGPGWTPEQWSLAATSVGLRTHPTHRTASRYERRPSAAASVGWGELLVDSGAQTSPNPPPALDRRVVVTVVGGSWFGAVGEEVGRKACALAATAGCGVLEVVAVGDVVVRVGAWVDVGMPEVADAVTELMDGAL